MQNPPPETLKNKELNAGFSAFAFMKILMYFVIFVPCIENIHRNVLLLSKASLALLRIDVPASLSLSLLPGVPVVLTHSSFALFSIHSAFSLWFGQSVHVIRCHAECAGHRRGKSALAPSPAFLCGWIITYIRTESCQLPAWPLSPVDGCQENYGALSRTRAFGNAPSCVCRAVRLIPLCPEGSALYPPTFATLPCRCASVAVARSPRSEGVGASLYLWHRKHTNLWEARLYRRCPSSCLPSWLALCFCHLWSKLSEVTENVMDGCVSVSMVPVSLLCPQPH